MSKEAEEIKKLQAENAELQAKLDEAVETLRAIRSGEVDALVVNAHEGDRIYTLEGAEQPYRVMVENMFAGACTTMEDGTIIYSNEHFAGMLKAPLEKVTGSSILSLVSDEDKAKLEALFKRANAIRISEEIKLRAPDGSEVPTYLSINTVPADHAHMTIVAIDLTERRRAEEQVRLQNERLNVTLRSIGDAVIATDKEGRVTFMNPVAERTTGWESTQAVGQPLVKVFNIINELTREPAENPVARVLREGRVVGLANHTSLISKSGDELIIEDSAAPIRDANGDIIGVILVFHDATEKHRSEQEALHTQKLESLRVLAGGIAHDLNNLMVAVMGNAGLALHALPPGSPAREYVADIEKATEKVTNFSKQILSFTSKIASKREPIQVNEVVKDTAHFLMASISKTVDLEYSLSDDLPAIMADSQNMQQIVMNLIINASDAIDDNKGTIKVSTGKIRADRKYLDSLRPSGLPEGDYVYVEVKDTGCGMSPETHRRIFEPFFTTKFTGRGIGLSAVYGIVQAHGGAIGLESELGCGSTFRILLPVPAKSVKAISAAPVSEDIWSGKGSILVCDDDRDSLMMAKHVLESAGYSVLTAEDGAEAIKIYRKNSDTISIAILDLIMPHIRGDEAAKEMRKIRDDINVLLLSGYHEIDLTELTRGSGKTATLGKPYRITKLLTTVQDILKD